MQKTENKIIVNEMIRSREVRVEGKIINTSDAIKMANEQGLDLILVAPNANPPVCKIMDVGKFIYEQKRREKDKEKQNRLNRVDVKELRFRINTDDHDFNFKANNAIRFLKDGDKVKASIDFKGREIVYKDKGEFMLLRLAEAVSEHGRVEFLPKMEGKKMFMIIAPKK